MRVTGGADAAGTRVDVGEETGDGDRLRLGEFQAVGDGSRDAGARRGGRAARLTAAARVALPEAWGRRLAGQRIASTTSTGPRRHGELLPRGSSSALHLLRAAPAARPSGTTGRAGPAQLASG